MKKKLTFEESVSRLEEIIADLEDEQKPLDEMLAVYTEGVKLLGNCRAQLDKTEEKMQQAVSKENA